MTEAVVFAFLYFLTHEWGRALPTLSLHLITLNDPLDFGGALQVGSKELSLVKSCLFLQHPLPRLSAMTGSLQKVLHMLLHDQAFLHPDVNHQLAKTLLILHSACDRSEIFPALDIHLIPRVDFLCQELYKRHPSPVCSVLGEE